MRRTIVLFAALALVGCGGKEEDVCALTADVSVNGHTGTEDFSCVRYFRDGAPFAHCDVTHEAPGVWTCEDAAGQPLASEASAAIWACRNEGAARR